MQRPKWENKSSHGRTASNQRSQVQWALPSGASHSVRTTRSPAVHPIASAPPEAQCSFCALRGTNLIESGTCPIRFFHRLLFYIAHPEKIDHQPFGVRSDVRIIAFLNIKLLLLVEHQCCISGRSLTETDYKKRRRHEIQREHIKLNADPQH